MAQHWMWLLFCSEVFSLTISWPFTDQTYRYVPAHVAISPWRRNTWTICHFIIYQMVSLAPNWSKRLTWLKTLQLKLGNIPVIFPNFQHCMCEKNIWWIINTIASTWRKISLDICPSKLTVFLELCSRKTVLFSEQIMSADKYPSMESIAYIYKRALLSHVKYALYSQNIN